MRARIPLDLGRLLSRTVAARYVAGPEADDALRVARELVAAGRRVGFEHAPADPADDGVAVLVDRFPAAGLGTGCDVRLDADRLGANRVRSLAAAARAAGLDVVLAGSADAVAPLAADLADATVVVPAAEPGAEARCRALAARGVRLIGGRGAAVDLAFVRCLNVLMAGTGRPGVATTDRRLIAIAGERAAWNDRPPESWEHVMPCGVRTDEQQRLVAAGHGVRVTVPWGAGALGAAARHRGGRA